MTGRDAARLLMVCLVGVAFAPANAADPSLPFVHSDQSGRLVYGVDTTGNQIPDFSHCGYRGGGVSIPNVPVRVSIPWKAGDSTARIQAAIEYVARLPEDENGFRGTVLLKRGRHDVSGQIRLAVGGIVLRGEGLGDDGTVIVATGTARRTLIRVCGRNDRQLATDSRHEIGSVYVPVGATQFRLTGRSGLRVGDTVVVTHPGTSEWIAAVGMNRFPSHSAGSWLDWRPGRMDLNWERVVTAIDGDSITVNAPLTSALDQKLAVSTVTKFDWPGRLIRAGIENLRCESTFDASNPHDEDHAWGAISFENAQDGWVRNVEMRHFAGSAVAIFESCRQITVQDCDSREPVSEIAGGRRHTFYTNGQQVLFHRCRAEQGRHDLAVGWLSSGPNAFVECQIKDARQFSGPIESWASGVLFDNIDMDGGGLALTNRETDGHGVGWAAANCVLWQCSAPVITCRMPPTAQNWAIGCWGQFVGDGHWRSLNQFVKPDSLYFAQLAERLGLRAVEQVQRPELPTGTTEAPAIDDVRPDTAGAASDASSGLPRRRLQVQNGWLTIDDRLVVGSRLKTVWWRGHAMPTRATELGVGITRFVPGRVGAGFTDDLDELTDAMLANQHAALEHHWGLWYDRRRDDHEMIRRIDGEVWSPFYEQPWARSGHGRAWDGLSRYDLTRFNPWYFARLKEFADHCDRKGLVLIQQMYFQHNLLEAGAHWADFPWRPANCLQETGFPEPPPYVDRKRIFLADQFYDISHPVRRQLHRAYIRHCLDVLGDNSNVIYMTGEEFTGSLSFVQFWIDTIGEWQRESGRNVLIGLSTTKDVQDAILADPQRGPLVKVIDLKYWWHTADGSLYAPPGGRNLAPRQQWREWQGDKRRAPHQTARQVREYRVRYSDKAVMCSFDPGHDVAALAGGASLPALHSLDDRLKRAIPRMVPLAQVADSAAAAEVSTLRGPAGMLMSAPRGARLDVDLTRDVATYRVRWIDAASGRIIEAENNVTGGVSHSLAPPSPGAWILWLCIDS